MAWGQEEHQRPDPRHGSEAGENWTDARVTGKGVWMDQEICGIKGIRGAHSSSFWVGTLGTGIRTGAPEGAAAGAHVVY